MADQFGFALVDAAANPIWRSERREHTAKQFLKLKMRELNPFLLARKLLRLASRFARSSRPGQENEFAQIRCTRTGNEQEPDRPCEPCTALPDDPDDPQSVRRCGKRLECGIYTFSERMQ
jgi:hypothetical protein